MYQSIPVRLASSDPFRDSIIDACRRMSRSATGLSPAERQLLWDVQRSETRYQFKSLRILSDIAVRCTEPEDALALSEAIRSYVLGSRAAPNPGLLMAFELEQRANHVADIAQLHALADPSPFTIGRAIEALVHQELRSREAVDVLHASLTTEPRVLRLMD